jgi:DNA primase
MPRRIKQSSIDIIRSHADICDIVSAYVSLRRSGSYLRGLSPFNDERTPSFFVHPERKVFKCYSSGKFGDVFAFLQQKEQMTFPEVVEFLAQKYSIPIEYEDGTHDAANDGVSKSTLLAIHERAGTIFQEHFLSATQHGHEARTYWTRERNFSLANAESYWIGLAPWNMDGAMSALTRCFSAEELIASGIFIQNNDSPDKLQKQTYSRNAIRDGDISNSSNQAIAHQSLFCRFRGRLMIPIHDVHGRIVAFSGRLLPQQQCNTSAAKYINSPETALFHKSSLLFGMHHARSAAEENDAFLLTEGPLDCFRCWECGFHTAVSVQGTGVTSQHLAILRRYCADVECIMDGDEAGLKAALRIVPLAFNVGISIRFLCLPNGMDPDAFFLKHGSSGLKQLRKKSFSAVEFLVRSFWTPVKSSSYAKRQEGLRQILAVIAETKSLAEELDLLNQLTELTGIPFETLQADHTARSQMNDISDDGANLQLHSNTTISSACEFLLHLFISVEDNRQCLASAIAPEWLDYGIQPERLLNIFIGEWENGVSPEKALESLSEEDRSYVGGLMFTDFCKDDAMQMKEQCIQRLHRKYIERELAKLSDKRGREAAEQRTSLRRELLQF